MSTSVTPATPATAPVAAPAKPKTAIQIIEEQIVAFFKQREQAIANVHAIDGAIQGAQNTLGILKGEMAKAEAEAKKLLGEAKTEVENLASKGVTTLADLAKTLKADSIEVVDAVESEAKKL